MDQATQSWEEQCLYILQFADDQMVIANDRKDIEYMGIRE